MLPFENEFGVGGGSYVPSFDFELFDLPNFSPLQANEFGAFTSFSANTPTSFTDYSLDRLLGLLRTPNPVPFPTRNFGNDFELENMLRFFQSQGSVSIDDVRGKQPTNQIIVYPSGTLPPELQGKGQQPEVQRKGCTLFDMITGRCTPAILSPTGGATASEPNVMVSDGKGTMGTEGSKSIAKWIEALPQGTGIFLIGLVALVFLFLFARK